MNQRPLKKQSFQIRRISVDLEVILQMTKNSPYCKKGLFLLNC